MHIRLLGTAAAEGWPALFCRCDNCRRARAAGGKNLRSRASVCVDDVFQFDFGPDTYLHVLQGHALAEVRHLIFTHSHFDHLSPAELACRLPPFAHGQDQPLAIYGHDRVLDRIRGSGHGPERLGLGRQADSGYGALPRPVAGTPTRTGAPAHGPCPLPESARSHATAPVPGGLFGPPTGFPLTPRTAPFPIGCAAALPGPASTSPNM